ncbi:hypothetical protein V8G54_029368 [Vigna mungo]|uniref:Uncharacterized protein n=1 Tax=Vigna mungo TaxID=3915 RepID=A0AAQ3MTQ6_VIGMU
MHLMLTKNLQHIQMVRLLQNETKWLKSLFQWRCSCIYEPTSIMCALLVNAKGFIANTTQRTLRTPLTHQPPSSAPFSSKQSHHRQHQSQNTPKTTHRPTSTAVLITTSRRPLRTGNDADRTESTRAHQDLELDTIICIGIRLPSKFFHHLEPDTGNLVEKIEPDTSPLQLLRQHGSGYAKSCEKLDPDTSLMEGLREARSG